MFINLWPDVLQFEENEKKRMKAEQQRQEGKHKKQWEDLVFRNDSSLRELEQLQVMLGHLVTGYDMTATGYVRSLSDRIRCGVRKKKFLRKTLIPAKVGKPDSYFDLYYLVRNQGPNKFVYPLLKRIKMKNIERNFKQISSVDGTLCLHKITNRGQLKGCRSFMPHA